MPRVKTKRAKRRTPIIASNAAMRLGIVPSGWRRLKLRVPKLVRLKTNESPQRSAD